MPGNRLILCAIVLMFVSSGCSYGPALELGGSDEEPRVAVPVVEREQAVDFQLLEDLVASIQERDYRYVKTFRRFAPPAVCIGRLESASEVGEGCRKERNLVETELRGLDRTYPHLAALFDQVLDPAVAVFSQRQVPDEIRSRYYPFLTSGGTDELRVLVLDTGNSGILSARYFPEGIIALLGVQDRKIAADPDYRAQVGFLIAHELGHAIAMHSLEDQTGANQAAGKMASFSNTQADVRIDKAYRQLDPLTAETVDKTSAELSTSLLTEEDIQRDREILQERKNSATAQWAGKLGLEDKLRMLGIGLTVPQQTRLVVKELIAQGLDPTEVFDLLRRGSADMALTVNLVAHSKEQEFEADEIGGYLLRQAGISLTPVLGFMGDRAAREAEQQKRAPIIGGYPSFAERTVRLKASLAN